MEDILCLDLGSTREDPGTSRPFVTRGVRSDGPSADGKFSDDDSDSATCPANFLTYAPLHKPKICVMHGGTSWEPARRADAAARAEKGKPPSATRTFVCAGVPESTTGGRVPAYLKCMRCRQFVCLGCVRELSSQLDKCKDQANTPYSSALHQLLDAKLPANQSTSSSIILSIPGSTAHCCELKVRALAEKKSKIAIEKVNNLSSSRHRKSRKQCKRKIAKQKKASAALSGTLYKTVSDKTTVPVDGVFGLEGFDAAIFPSLKFPDTLSLAQMGDKGLNSARFQEGVSHSVIPNKLAYQYERNNIAPVGILSDVALFDKTEDVKVVCPLDGCTIISVRVRMIGIRRSTAQEDKTPAGGCHFDKPEVFMRCVPLLDRKMEQEDQENGIDVTMVLGESSPNDNGTSMHNLTTRFYKEEWSIPEYGDLQLDALTHQLFSSLPKSGFEPMRRGGSGGIALPDKDFFDYFAQHRGSSPRLTNAVKFIQRNDTSWQMLYITPYKCEITVACPPSMGAPRHGGQIKITSKNIVGYEEFFMRFVYVRALTGCLLHVINQNKKKDEASVVPDAVTNQMAQNQRARDHSQSRNGRIAYLIDACSFTLVAHAVGNHQDTAQGSKRKASSQWCIDSAFIENRALFRSPSNSTSDTNDYSLWRGGNGSGDAVYAIVDHPKPVKPRIEERGLLHALQWVRQFFG